MTISVATVAPRVIVLGVVGYCLWPTMSDLMSQPENKPPQKLPELSAALFAPQMPAASTRDPFMSGDMAASAGIATNSPRADKVAGSKGSAAAANKSGRPPAVAARGSDPLKGLTLEATCVLGDERLAVINGQLYGQRDTLATGNPSLPSYQIVSVSPYKVLLAAEGKTVELTYSNTPSHPGRSPAARPGSSRGRKPGASRPSR
jgi:hypothetical protein